MERLPEIPRYLLGDGPPVKLVDMDRARFEAIMGSGLNHYGGTVLRLGDRFSCHWLKRNGNPHLADVTAIAAKTEIPGAYLLNLSYEWTCTSSTSPDPAGNGNRLLRTLDWPMDGLGRNVVVASCDGPAGPYENITWPGFAGVVTAMAPGRFAAAINQPPMRRWSFSCWLDWGVNRVRLWRRRALPPVHLLRQAFETCETYAAAKQILMQTPLAMPAFFTLSGIEPAEGCVIERTEEGCQVREAPASVANHWIATGQSGRDRGIDSGGRYTQMEALRDQPVNDFTWVVPPILNETTRLAVMANAQQGTLAVQGWERAQGFVGPATQVFKM